METIKETIRETMSRPEPIFSPLACDPDLAEIVALFVDEMPGRIHRLHRLLESGEWEELRRAAHQLKGSAGSHGFEPVSLAAGELESALKSGAAEPETRRFVERLADICRSVRADAPD